MSAALAVGAAFVVAHDASTGAQSADVPPGPQTPLTNPPISDSCGTNVTLVLDASGSISSSNAVDDVRDAGEAFLDALADTGSTARVLQFASISEELAAQAEVTAASLAPGGVFRGAITDYYNPKPARPGNVTIHRYDGRGDPQSASNWTTSNGSNQYTNWDQSLDQAGEPQTLPTELILYVTDGDPTAYDFDQPGDPFDAGPPPDVAMNTNRGDADDTTLDRAVQEANEAKAAGTRILAVGVGSAVTGSPSSRQRLIEIAGPQTADDDDLDTITSINDIDVALVQDFDKLAAFLRGVVSELCSPSLSIRKLAQTPGDVSYTPTPDWEITVTPAVVGGTWSWILPDTDAAQAARCTPVPTDPDDQAARTCDTDSAGLVTFQWEPDPSDAQTTATVSEELQTGYTPGRPGADDDWTCTFKNIDGSQEVQQGDFTTLTPPTFALDVDPEQIITCSIFNSFDYEPDIALTKVNSPVVVRGDLTPTYGPGPATVTSTFEVTNPGNTPLTNVDVDDDQCTPVDPVTQPSGNNVGDTNDDGRLDTTETWQFDCTREIVRGLTTDPIKIVNTAVALGTDPAGTPVTSPTVQDDVDVIVPAIFIDKKVQEVDGADPPADEITVVVSSIPEDVDVTYSYEVTSDGNTPLALTDPLVDDTCSPVAAVLSGAFNAGDTDTDGLLDVGETWRYTCDATVDDTTTNTVTVEGTPDPDDIPPSGGFPGVVDPTPNPNPPVTATDTATVRFVEAGIQLDKSVDRPLVLSGTTVEYEFIVTNTAAAPLVPDGLAAPADGTGTPGGLVISDPDCTPITFIEELPGGDGDGRLETGEQWRYTCSAVIVVDTLNTATVTGQPVGTSTDLTDTDTALVEVRAGAIEVVKDALRPAVLDPDAPAVDGPDVPTRRQAVYVYRVSNPGDLPLDLTLAADDVIRISDDTCSPVAPVESGGFNVGDANDDDLLDVDEVWLFTCTQTLDKDDGVPSPADPELPGLVTNTVTVIGSPMLGADRGPDVSDSDTAEVLVIEPSLTIVKTPCLDSGLTTCVDDPLVRPDTPITYRYVVTNTGDTGLDVVDVVDDRCSPTEYVSGDDGNGVLDGGTSPESWTFRCTTPVNFPSPVVNTATVKAVGALENVYEATDTAQVRVFEPAIQLVKSVSADFVPVGSDVTYTFEVTNVGDPGSGVPADVILSDIVLADVSLPANPACRSPAFQGGDTNGNDLLEAVDGATPAEVWTYTCTGTIDEQTVDVAWVRGTDILDGLVFDFDDAIVTPYDAGIDIVKTATPVVLPVGGGSVTYTYEVVNTGDVPLADVNTRVTDDRCAPVEPVLEGGFNVGDVDRNGLLTSDDDLFETGVAETWLFECTTTLTETTLNTVTTLGTPVRPTEGGPQTLGPDVSATDTALVTVPEVGSITIVKVAEPNSPQPFSFGGDLGSFSLVDDGGTGDRRTFTGLTPGRYQVSESLVVGWDLVSITCVDPSSNTTVDVGMGAATIELGANESVTCTFLNRNRGIGTLPSTGGGSGAQTVLVTALGLLLVGGALLMTGRRRRSFDRPQASSSC